MKQGLSVARILSVVLCFAVSTLLLADDQPRDGNIKSIRGKCSVTFPGKPTLDADPATNTDTYVLSESGDKYVYVVNIGYLNQKADMSNEALIKKAKDAMHDRLCASLNAKPTKMVDGTFGKDKWPTRYYEFNMTDGDLYCTQIVMSPDCVVSLAISGPPAWTKSEKAQAFLKSLKFESSK